MLSGDEFCCSEGNVILNGNADLAKEARYSCNAIEIMQPNHLKLATELKDSRGIPAPASGPPLPEDVVPSLPAMISALEARTEGSSSCRRNPLSS